MEGARRAILLILVFIIVFQIGSSEVLSRHIEVRKGGWRHVSQRPLGLGDAYVHGYTMMSYMPQTLYGEKVVGMLRELYWSEIAYPGTVFVKWIDWVVFEDGRLVSSLEWDVVNEGYKIDPVFGIGIIEYSLYEYSKKEADWRFSDRNIGMDIDTVEGPSNILEYGSRHSRLGFDIILMIQPSENEDFEMGVLDLKLADIGTFVLFKSFDSDVVHVFFEPKEF